MCERCLQSPGVLYKEIHKNEYSLLKILGVVNIRRPELKWQRENYREHVEEELKHEVHKMTGHMLQHRGTPQNMKFMLLETKKHSSTS